MVLMDKLAGYTGNFAVGQVVPQENKVPRLDAHAWSKAIGLWLSEGIGNKASIVSAFALSIAEGNQLDLVETFFNTLTDRQKDRFMNRVESLTILLQFRAVADGTAKLCRSYDPTANPQTITGEAELDSFNGGASPNVTLDFTNAAPAAYQFIYVVAASNKGTSQVVISG